MYLKIVILIVFSSFNLNSLVLGYATRESRGPGKYFSAFRHRDSRDPNEWSYNYVDDQRPIANQIKPNSFSDGRANTAKFEIPNGDLLSRISRMQKPHNELAKNDELGELLLDRLVPISYYEEYVGNDFDDGSDFQKGMFNVYFPDGRPQNINFEGKILEHPQF
ncbi:uncharacterized protein LOC111051449 [Nilaparvata lugens]|uniref:uncharacterized protein LOC111051449 n=1 Tax=Nilaparvata lugens TaxID=108931 RepID=UPI00193E7485|nr:uncharacterized protein LOC111051449 [Nilaparvata lugens]